MKKQWIGDAVYLFVALIFVGIYIWSEGDRGKEVLGTNVTMVPSPTDVLKPTEEPEPTKVPEPTEEPESTIVPEPTETAKPTEALKPTEAVEPTKAPEPTEEPKPTEEPSPTEEPEPTEAPKPTDVPELTQAPTQVLEGVGRMPGAIAIRNENYEQYKNEGSEWWFSRKKNHAPSGSGEKFPIDGFSAFYLDKNVQEEDKVMYITFDCGYENGFTPSILDTLAEKDVKAMFFVTRQFVADNPDYVKRMKEEGHLVGNHTVRHLASSTLTPEELEAELYEVARLMEETTGYRMDPFFRPPMGEYSERVLKVIQDMGYSSVFWSIAYYDYDVNDQPGKDYVVDHFDTYHHNGSIVLMHNTSESNAQALGDVLDLLKKEGYRLAPLTELYK